MKKLILILMLGSLFAQYLPDVSQMSETEKMLVFENNKKSPALGVVFSLLLPSTGHAYAKNWKRGLLFTGSQALTGITMFYFASLETTGDCSSGYEYDSDYYDEDKPCESLDGTIHAPRGRDPMHNSILNISTILFPILIIWESVDAAKQVKKYNNNVYRKIFDREPPSFSLNLQPTYQGANLTMSYSFN